MPEQENVRQAYVSLIQDIQDSREELIDPTSDRLSQCLSRANNLYKNVKSAREQALDSQTLTLISHAAVDKLERFRTDFKDKHEPIQFVNKLKEWLKGNEDTEDEEFDPTLPPSGHEFCQINWADLGKRVLPYVWFNGCTRKKKKKVVRQQKEKSTPIIVAKEGIDTANQVGKETTKYVEQIYKTVKNENTKKPLYNSLINPNDFGQTVENFFYLSFLVKDGHVRISNSGTEPILEPADQPSKEDYSAGIADKKQCVVKLDYKSWQKVIQEKQLKDSYIPHRDYNALLTETRRRKEHINKLNSNINEEEDSDEKSEEEIIITNKTNLTKRKRSSQSSISPPPARKKRKTS